MRIKNVTLSNNNYEERIKTIFIQLGAKEHEENGNEVLSMFTLPAVMEEKVEIAYELLRRLGYTYCSQAMKPFWYISEAKKKLPTISIESQGAEGFVQEKHTYLIYWS